MNFCMIHVYQNSTVSGIREILNIGKVLKMMHWRNGSYMIWFYEKEKLTTWSIKLIHFNFADLKTVCLSQSNFLCVSAHPKLLRNIHMYAYMHLIDILWATYIFTNKKNQMCTTFWINTNKGILIDISVLVYQTYKSIKDFFFCFKGLFLFLFSFCFNMNVLFLFFYFHPPLLIITEKSIEIQPNEYNTSSLNVLDLMRNSIY